MLEKSIIEKANKEKAIKEAKLAALKVAEAKTIREQAERETAIAAEIRANISKTTSVAKVIDEKATEIATKAALEKAAADKAAAEKELIEKAKKFIFTPKNIKSAKVIAWFDASDINGNQTVVKNGVEIKTWIDKSGKDNNATGGGWGNPPVVLANNLNKLSVLNLRGTSQLSFNLGSNVSSYSIFTVQLTKGPYAQSQRLLHGQSGFDGRLLYGINGGTDTWMTGFGNDKWTNLETNLPVIHMDNKWALSDIVVNNPSNSAFPSVNGTNQTQKNMKVKGFDSMTIGCKNGGVQPWQGYIAEIIILKEMISDEERQKVQGYLAWKWGLQNNLPSDHPYKIVAPNNFITK